MPTPTTGLRLRVDPLLGTDGDHTGVPKVVCRPLDPPSSKPTAVVITEGIPPIPARVLDRICKWEYIDLASLLEQQQDGASQNITVSQSGQLVVLDAGVVTRRSKPINDILTWLHVFSIYMAALVSSNSTSKEEAAGLVAHLHLILQLAKDLGGSQWLAYDQHFREWAAASGVRKWGELNFAIYGRCLAHSHMHKSAPEGQPPAKQSRNSSFQYNAKRKRDKEPGVCYRWNENAFCDKGQCKYMHLCIHCRGNHRGTECPRQARR